jgi:hypothetical protein
MRRRSFLSTSAALGAGAAFFPAAKAAPLPVNAVEAIKALRINTGPYAGAFEVAPNGRLNWYFSALGLLPAVQWMTGVDREHYVRGYLDTYLRHVTPAFTIDDVDFPLGRADPTRFVKVPSDSDDSYAATLLSLAARYFHASNNVTWWNANRQRLKDIAYRNLTTMVKPNGLTSVFQPPRNQTNAIGYLMDNCEVYRGLRDFAGVLRHTGDTADANYYDSFARTVGLGVARLFHSASGSFLAGDAYATPETSFYPGTTCQVFPQLFGVAEAQAGFTSAWNYLTRHSPGWETGRYDTYPWMLLGAVAAKRGLRTQAAAQMRLLEERFASNRPTVIINELGFYLRISSILSGSAEV